MRVWRGKEKEGWSTGTLETWMGVCAGVDTRCAGRRGEGWGRDGRKQTWVPGGEGVPCDLSKLQWTINTCGLRGSALRARVSRSAEAAIVPIRKPPRRVAIATWAQFNRGLHSPDFRFRGTAIRMMQSGADDELEGLTHLTPPPVATGARSSEPRV